MIKLYLSSLGCDKNLSDSEHMLGILLERGFELTQAPEEAEVAVVNTCCFIDDAKKESIDELFDIARYKEEGNLKVLIAAGCMAQRYKDEILNEMPEIDGIVGTTMIESIADTAIEALHGKRLANVRDASDDGKAAASPRVLTGPGHYAYLKIAEGCDKCCTYCAIPSFRGHYRSYPMEDLLKEATSLAERGVKELIIVAQETTLYGTDLYGEKKLHELLSKLCRIEGFAWIRVLYAYPEEIYPALIETMAKEDKICKYLDMPVQHAADTVLKRMNRRTSKKDLLDIISSLRKAMPDIVLRTTLITGFPGETEEEHGELLDFVKEVRFERLGVFAYSKEEGTPASRMKPQITAKVKKERRRELMLLQQGISSELRNAMIGRTEEVIVEGYLPDDGVAVGRTRGDAPNVDGMVFFGTEGELVTGSLVKVRITGSSEYDLYGEMLCDEDQ